MPFIQGKQSTNQSSGGPFWSEGQTEFYGTLEEMWKQDRVV